MRLPIKKILLSALLALVMLHARAAPVVNDNPEAEALFRQGQELLKLAGDEIDLSDLAWTAAHYKDDGPNAPQVKHGWQLIEQAADRGNRKAIRCMAIYFGVRRDQRYRQYLEAAAQAGDGPAAYRLADMRKGSGADHLGLATREETVQMLADAASDGDTDAMRGWCGSYNGGNFPPGQEEVITAKCKAWANSSEHKSIPDYLERCLAHDPEIHCSEATRRVYQRMKDNIKEWERLMLQAAEAGDPKAQGEWCFREKNKTETPVPAVTEKCGLWNEQSAARGNWRAWGEAPYRYDSDPKIASLQSGAYVEGRSIIFGDILPGSSPEPTDTERGRPSTNRCLFPFSGLSSYFDELVCAPPRPGFPKWRGLGKDFKAPRVSAAAEKLHQDGLNKLAAQDIKGAETLLKKAANAGHTGAMINLALAYLEYPEVLFDLRAVSTDAAVRPAWELVAKADAKGDLRAHYLLAYFSYRGVHQTLSQSGKGITKDYVVRNRLDAERYRREAAERGLARAQYVLGWRLIREEQEKEGWDWLKRAYDNGERIAGFDLYRIARYVWKDNAQAIQYLRSTATDGELASADLLAEIYDKGLLGETKNAARAACYRAAVTAHKDMTWEQRLDLRLSELGRCQ